MADFNRSANERYDKYCTDAVFWYLGAPDFEQKLEPIESHFHKFTDTDPLIIRKCIAQSILGDLPILKAFGEVVRASILQMVKSTKKVNWKREGF